MIRALIVDDEPLARRGIQLRLERLPDVEVVGQSANGRRAVEDIRSLKPDLVFLDVQMPGMTGFDVLDAIGPESMPLVIFVTAYDKHALRAFDVHAVDYILKPIDDERFARSVSRAREHLDRRKQSELSRRLTSLLAEVERETQGWGLARRKRQASHSGSADPHERFLIKSAGRIIFVKAADIDWVEAAGDYVCLHVSTETHLLRDTMASMEDRLDSLVFLRVHRSTIVNTARIAELHPHMNGEYRISLRDGTRLKTGRSYRDSLRRFFGEDL